MAKNIRIEAFEIGEGHTPFIVAEMSGNHNGSLERALELVDKAAECGVNAIKIQTYTADTITLPIKTGRFYIDDPKSLWYGKSLYELYQIAATPYEWHKPIFERCKKHGLVGFSTPFDPTAVDFLETLNVPCYKIGALEIIDHELIRKCAATKKPLIISAGCTTLGEID
ncbi:MAG TPA: N-acetylneuraminate synthase family protein, partial [Chlamydiales bacterium]|nr:N-acetylneuraminate synthase family protein [Chlamydiales bacterium]